MKLPFKNLFKGMSIDDLEDLCLTATMVSLTILVFATSLLLLSAVHPVVYLTPSPGGEYVDVSQKVETVGPYTPQDIRVRVLASAPARKGK